MKVGAVARWFTPTAPPASPPRGHAAPADTVTLRRVGPESAETLAAIDRRSFKHPWSVGDFRDALEESTLSATVAMLGSTPIGAILMNFARMGSDAVCVDSMAIVPEAQCRKLGQKLLVEGLLEARDRGAERSFLEVDETNTAAIRLYEKVGYKTVERLPGYYAHEGHDGLLMELKDLQSDAVGRRLADLESQTPR